MRKWKILLLALAVAAGSLAGCGRDSASGVGKNGEAGKSSEADAGKSDGKLRVITTMFPEYDWTREILGGQEGRVELSMLTDSGVDLHSYQPSVEDMMEISSCDLFIYVGGESDAWVADALKESANKDRKVICLMDVLGDQVREEEIVEGMEEEHDDVEEDHDDEEDIWDEDGADADDALEYDEHVWLSLENAEVICEEIAEVLGEIDPEYAKEYLANAEKYEEKLEALSEEYEAMAEAAPQKVMLFGDRFPFRYLAEDYGLEYYAAFAGCSTETEASFETVAFLANKIDELGLEHVLVIEKSDQKLAKTIIQNTKTKDQKILTVHSMQSVTEEELEAGENYLSIMEENLAVLKQAVK